MEYWFIITISSTAIPLGLGLYSYIREKLGHYDKYKRESDDWELKYKEEDKKHFYKVPGLVIKKKEE